MVYGMLTDANIELGKYDDAEKSAQWMLDLRPGNIPALTRAAYLRELFGDIEGAIELMQAAFGRMPYQETEDRAWVLTQIGHLELVRQRPAEAERALEQALELFPNYHYALGSLAEVRTAQKRHREAADLQQQRYAVAPHPENLYELAEAQARAGMTAEAAQSYAQFEAGARREMRQPGQRQPRAGQLPGRRRQEAGGRAGAGPAGDRPAPGRLHPRGLRLGAVQERQAGRGAQGDRRGARRRRAASARAGAGGADPGQGGEGDAAAR